MDCAWDADFRDHQHYQLTNSKVQINNDRSTAAVPDLSSLTDTEFLERIAAMKREHQKTLQLCDELGLKPSAEVDLLPSKPSLPMATVNDNYMISTSNYCSPAGDLITSSDRDVRRPFKARKAPPRRKLEKDESTRIKRKNTTAVSTSMTEEEQMKMYMLERYLSTYDEHDDARLTESDDIRPGPDSYDCSWRPRVTVPKPFSMTIRESLGVNNLTRSMADLQREREERLRKELKECNKKFKASPAPANIYVPLYEELAQERELRRQLNLARRQDELKEMQKPFAFLRREEERQSAKQRRQALFAEADGSAPDANFKAKPFPEHIYNNDANEKLRRQEEMRMEERFNRAEAMMQISSLPPNMKKERPRHICDMTHGDDDDDGRCHSPCRNNKESLVDGRSKSPVHHSNRRSDSGCRPDYTDALWDEDTRPAKRSPTRWPQHSLSGCFLSRSVSDLLSATGGDAYSSMEFSRPIRNKSVVTSQSNQKSHKKKSSVGRPSVSRSSFGSSSATNRPPIPKPSQSSVACAQASKWRATDSRLQDRIRREIEEDLKNIDLTVN